MLLVCSIYSILFQYCYRLNVCVQQISRVKILILKVMMLGDSDFGGWLGLVPLWMRPKRGSSPCPPCEFYSEKTAICESGSELSPDIKSNSNLILDFPTPVQYSSVIQSCLTLWDPMNHSMPGLTVHHQLPEFTQTQVRWVSDAIQPSHPLSSPSSPAPNPSQHQSLFQWVNSSHEVAKVLEFQL